MNIQEELSKLETIMKKGTDPNHDTEFMQQVAYIKDNAVTEDDKQAVLGFMGKGIADIKEKSEELLHEVSLRRQMAEIADLVSISYIAKYYFGKSHAWLSQRINGNIVNGKPCYFTRSEIEKLNDAIHDISQRLGSFSISY